MKNSNLLTKIYKRLASWRAVVCFALPCLFLFSCKKDPMVGNEIQPGTDFNEVQIAELKVSAYTDFRSPLRSDESFSFIGRINDEAFGLADASFFATVGLADVVINESTFSGAVVDSVKLELLVDFVYGDRTYPQKMQVYPLTESINLETDYKSNQALSFDPAPISEHVLEFNATEPVGLRRITLPIDLGQEIIDNAGTTYTTPAQFDNWFNGFYFSIDGNPPTTEEGGAIYRLDLGLQSQLVIFYHTSSDTSEMVFPIDRSTARFNRFTHDYSGTVAETSISQDVQVQEKIYLEGMAGLKAGIEIPGLSAFVANKSIVNRAVITFEVDEMYTDFEPSDQLFLVRVNEDGEMFLLEDLVTNVERYGGDLADGKYEFEITRHVQALMEQHETGSAIGSKFELLSELPAITGNVANRTVLKGSKNISLRIYYTPLI